MSAPGSVVDGETNRDSVPPSDESSSGEEELQEIVKKKFDKILEDLRKDKLDLRDPDELKAFAAQYANYLGEKMADDSDGNTLLHLLVDDAKDKVISKYQPLVELLIERHPNLMKEKAIGRTPLYAAIYRKRDQLVRLMCEAHPEIDAILSIPCSNSENCLHVAIRRNIAPDTARLLIQKASEATLCAKDDKGNTPLHLAVDYDRCVEAQFDVVQDLILRCPKAMDGRTTKSNLSPYRYHEHTHAMAKIKAAEEKEKEVAQGKKEESSAPSGDGPGGKEAPAKFNLKDVVSKQKDVKAPKSIAGPKGQILSSLSVDTSKIEPLRRVNTSGETAMGRHANETGLYGGSRNAGTGPGSGEPPKMGPNVGRGLNPRTPVAPEESRRRRKEKEKEKEKEKPTEESANAIRDYMKLHYNQICFDLYDSLSLTISEERTEEGYDHVKFEDILQYVAFPSMKLTKKAVPSKFLPKPIKPDGKGRSDMVFLFNFLRKKRVKRIIRVIVDDMEEPAHSDEAIEMALGGLKVEIWDWRKLDLCTETILAAAPEAQEVFLYWGGNNAVLRGWSEPGGLNLLKKLQKVNLHVQQGLETKKRTSNNVLDFRRRLKALRSDVQVKVFESQPPERHDPADSAVETAHEQVVNRHKWLTCMDEFADFIQNVEPPVLDSPLPVREEVTLALIDDGVDVNEQSLHAKIIGGRSFCQRDKDQNLVRPYYVTTGGHGTVMAYLICRVCPKAQLFVMKLDEHVGEGGKRQITAKSAAKARPIFPCTPDAVRAAIDRKVHIISMSWTIEKTKTNGADIEALGSAIEDAAKAGILMFCAANDQGVSGDQSFPASCGTRHIFKIGAAEASGAQWKWVGDPNQVDFFLPGHNVVKERPNDAPVEKCTTLTGSSVATAIAAGLAALVLYCVQLGALYTEKTGLVGNAATMKDFEAMKGHERMKQAFQAIGTSQAMGNKYIEVWNVFEPAAKEAERLGKDRRIEVVARVAGRLKATKTFE